MRILCVLAWTGCTATPFPAISSASLSNLFEFDDAVAMNVYRCEDLPLARSGSRYTSDSCRALVQSVHGDPRAEVAVGWRLCHVHREWQTGNYCAATLAAISGHADRFTKDERRRIIDDGGALCADPALHSAPEGMIQAALCRTWMTAVSASFRQSDVSEAELMQFRKSACFYGDAPSCDDDESRAEAKRTTQERKRVEMEERSRERDEAARWSAERKAEDDARKMEELHESMQSDIEEINRACGGTCEGSGTKPSKQPANSSTTNSGPTCSGSTTWCPASPCNHHHGFCGTACDACYEYDK